MAISIHGPEDLGKYNSRPLITYEGNLGYCIIKILFLYLHQINKVLIIKNPLPMNTEELSNRLTQIVQGITNTHPIRIKATIEVFLEEFDPSQNYLLSISDIEGYETQFIEFEIWDKNDGPIPGIKLFKDLNIYLEREFCEY
jgi:hypothetical protein